MPIALVYNGVFCRTLCGETCPYVREGFSSPNCSPDDQIINTIPGQVSSYFHQYQPDLLSLTPNTCAQALVVRIVQFKMGTNPSASHLQNGRWHKRESAEMFQLVLERRSKSAWWRRAFPIWKKRIFDLGFLWPYFNMISISFKFRVFDFSSGVSVRLTESEERRPLSQRQW